MTSPVDDRFDVVFFWKQNDTGIYGRRQDMLVKYLARDPRIARIFHFDAPIRLLAAGNLAWESGRNAGSSQAVLILRQTLRRKLGLAHSGKVRSYTFLHVSRGRLNGFFGRFLPSAQDYPDYLERILRRQGLGQRRTLFWVCPNNFYFPAIQERFKPDLVVADVIDDQRTWPNTPERKAELAANYAEILGRSDLVFANCRRLLDGMRRFVPNIHLFPNAAEQRLGREGPFAKPGALRRIKGPIIGYAGNLDVVRIDLGLLTQIASKNPGWNLVFLGSTHKNRQILALKRFPNVHFLGIKPHDKAIRYISHFDVAILPHLDNELTRHMNPLKMYVYFSLNLPVVATPVADIEEFNWFAHVAGSPAAFIDGIARCLEADTVSPKAARMREWIAANCWERRVSDMMALVEDSLKD